MGAVRERVMDASKLRNSCICGNTRPYLECCGPYAEPPPGGAPAAGGAAPPAGIREAGNGGYGGVGPAGGHAAEGRKPGNGPAPIAFPRAARGRGALQARPDPGDDALVYAFRHSLHEMSMALFPLRALYQAYWEKIGREDYPHELLMEDPDYGRAILEDFFWDYFVQYSDARPILRTARELEGKALRLAHDLMQWSYAPLWFYQVEERTPSEARLRNLGNGKIHRVRHQDRLPGPGTGVLTRLLPFRGREFCGHAVLALPSPEAGAPADPSLQADRLETLFRAGCRELKVKPSVTLRPDVHCEEWRRHGSVFLALWRAETYDARVGRPMSPVSAGAARPGPVLEAAVSDASALEAVLASAPEIQPAGSQAWDLRYRALRLARLELRPPSALAVSVADPGFLGYVRDWVSERLGGAVSLAGGTAPDPLPGDGAADLDAWVHTPLESLNGQTPVQASTHDWGRRRLQLLLREMMKQGRDVTSLKRQLGL